MGAGSPYANYHQILQGSLVIAMRGRDLRGLQELNSGVDSIEYRFIGEARVGRNT